MTVVATILGGGVAGLCVAAELLRRGASVRVIDPGGAPGPHACSWWAGGMLAPDCEGAFTEEPVARLGRQAARWWAANGASVSFRGSVVVAMGRDRSELDTFALRSANHRTLDQPGLRDLEPLLGERFARALHMTDEAHLDPRDALAGLRQRLLDSGVSFLSDGPLHGQVIDCRGLSARDRLPDLRGVKGEMLVLHAPEVALSRPVRLLHPRYPLYVVPRGAGLFMLGATQIESGERGRASVRSVLDLLNAAYALHPAFGEAEILEIGVDARPAFPDNLPRIGRMGDGFYLNGLFRHGFLLAPAMAVMLADKLLEGKTPEVWHEDHR